MTQEVAEWLVANGADLSARTKTAKRRCTLPEGRTTRASLCLLGGDPAEALLRGYDWPGNVRQLIKVLKRSVYLELPLSEVIDSERELGALVAVEGDETGQHPLSPMTLADIKPMREVRREYAARALELNGGNYTATAKALGIAINTLRSYLAEWPSDMPK